MRLPTRLGLWAGVALLLVSSLFVASVHAESEDDMAFPLCTLRSCTPGKDTTGEVSYALHAKRATLNFRLTRFTVGDIRAVYLDAMGSGLNQTTCSVDVYVNGARVAQPNVEFNTMRLSGAPDTSMAGCPRHAFDWAIETGTPGVDGDDVQRVSVQLSCARDLLDADFANAMFGLRTTSLGRFLNGVGPRNGEDRLVCVTEGEPTLPNSCPAECSMATCPQPPVCRWVPNEWPRCVATDGTGCNMGVRERSLTCQCNGVAMADSNCAGAPKPPTKEDCVDVSQCTCAHRYGEWSQCSSQCGVGKRTRAAVCYCDGNERDSECTLCGSPQEPTEETCENYSQCGGQCKWRYDEWQTCIADNGQRCGAGKTTRNAYCEKTLADGSVKACQPEQCGPVDSCVQDCQDESGCKCEWVTSEWDQCVASNGKQCGAGSHSRDVKCQCGGKAADDAKCVAKVGPKPPSSESCQDDRLCNCKWRYDEWGVCVAENGQRCGKGQQTRKAYCEKKAADGSVVTCPSESCGAQDTCAKECDDQSGCKCDWIVTSEWSQCVASNGKQCGAGKKTRSVACKCAGSLGVTVDSKCDASKKPSVEESCQDDRLCNCKWRYDAWATCVADNGKRCGPGKTTRKAYCEKKLDNGSVVTCPSESCGAQDSCAQPCEDQSQCKCEWKFGEWGQCSAQCGKGQQTRSAQCMCGPYAADSSKCPKLQDCDVKKECSGAKCNCTWRYEPWGTCKANDGKGCGPGKKTRNVYCRATLPNGSTIDCQECDCSGAKPPVADECEDKSKCKCEYAFSDWSKCSNTCGDGFQTRTAQCKCGPYQTADCGSCGGNPPASELKRACKDASGCSTKQCAWQYDAWSECSSKCGAGKQTRAAKCMTVAKCGDGKPMECDKCSGSPVTEQVCTGSSKACKLECEAKPCAGDCFDDDKDDDDEKQQCKNKIKDILKKWWKWENGRAMQTMAHQVPAFADAAEMQADQHESSRAMRTQTWWTWPTPSVPSKPSCKDKHCLDSRATVSFEEANGGVKGTITWKAPAFADLRGVFIKFDDCRVDPDKCWIEGAHVSGVGRFDSKVPGDSSVNMNGCKPSVFHLLASLGTPGVGKDDIRTTTFTVKCSNFELDVDDLVGAQIGVRATSVGKSSSQRDESAKLMCQLPKAAATRR